MQINCAFKYELKPNREQRIALAKHAGTARFAYNWGLAARQKLYEETKTSTNAIAQHKELNALKKTDFPWMYESSKCAPQEALRDLDKAFKNFFRGLKAGQKIGFPKFKKKGLRDSFRLTGTIALKGKNVQLPKLGVLRLKEDPSKFSGRILSATVSRQADRWFVSLSVEREIETPSPNLELPAVGVDLGLTSFAVLSSGERFEAPKPLAKSLKLLKRRSKRLSRKQKGSNNKKKAVLALARLHRRVRNVRQDFLHKLTTHLTKTKSMIVIEDLCVKGMVKNRKLSRAISDVGWGEFRRQLEYKTSWRGSRLVVAPRFYPSSQLCSSCSVRNESLALSDRSWTCVTCGVEHDRDLNAAKNLLSLSTGSSPGIYACGQESSGLPPKRRKTKLCLVDAGNINGINVH